MATPTYVMRIMIIIFMSILMMAHNVLSQIRAEIISRTDTFSILGACSDNKIRIHNLPEGAHVNVSDGAAIRVSANEFILCRFYPYTNTHNSNYSETTLTVSFNGKTIYTKYYKIIPSRASGSIFNPILHATIGGIPQERKDGVDIWTMSEKEIQRFFSEQPSIRILNGDNDSVTSANLSILHAGSEIVGPFRFFPYKTREPRTTNSLHGVNKNYGLFFVEMVVGNSDSGFMYVCPLHIKIN